MEETLGERDMELALVDAFMNWAGADQLITFPDELILSILTDSRTFLISTHSAIVHLLSRECSRKCEILVSLGN